MPNDRRISRRGMIGGAVAVAASLSATPAASSAPTNPNRKRVLRIAHITDTHVKPERNVPAGIEAALVHVKTQKAELILHTGDVIMDALAATEARVQAQWEVWLTALANANLAPPIKYCLGNHDIWGWQKKQAQVTGDEPRFGKRWACEQLGIGATPYYSFDSEGWRFIMLDSVQPYDGGYHARIDDDQFAWLEKLLDETPASTHVCIASHVPIVSVTGFMFLERDPATTQPVPSPRPPSRYHPDRGDTVLPGQLQHGDWRKLPRALRQAPEREARPVRPHAPGRPRRPARRHLLLRRRHLLRLVGREVPRRDRVRLRDPGSLRRWHLRARICVVRMEPELIEGRRHQVTKAQR
ncbi:MAG: metallophosphoesterase [Tepidisphaeraceae bacterium]